MSTMLEYLVSGFPILTAALGGAAAWGGASVKMENIQEELREHDERSRGVVERLASIEEKTLRIDHIEQKLDRLLENR